MKRFGVIFVLFMIAGTLFAPRVNAQSQLFNPLPKASDIGTTVDQAAQEGKTNKELYSVNTVAILSGGVVCMITGCSSNPESSFYYGKSAIAQLSNITLAMYQNPPADLVLWFQDTGRSLGFLPKQAYAQGIGFTGLAPILPIWKAFRNISYALLALVMVIIGFMVMFRQKIDPKTVVTVQNALPKIVLALLLITFSYAIAAFFIDVMYLLMAIVINLIVSSSPESFSSDTASKFINGGIGRVIGILFYGGWSSIDDLVKLLFYNPTTDQLPAFLQGLINVVLLGGFYVVFALLVSIALLFGMVRIIFMLLSAYIQIIISVLIAPFQLMTEALPGSSSFSSWLKNLAANLSVFPVTAAMLLIGTMLTTSNAGRIWTPPLLSGSGANGVIGLIGLGFLLTIPSIANGIKEALKAKAPVEAGLGAILGPVGGGVGQMLQYGYYAGMAKSLFRKTPQGEEGGDLQTGIKGAQRGVTGK